MTKNLAEKAEARGHALDRTGRTDTTALKALHKNSHDFRLAPQKPRFLLIILLEARVGIETMAGLEKA
jgi:hypothetical protein